MRMAAAAARQPPPGLLAERLGHPAGRVASAAAHLDVGREPADPDLAKLQHRAGTGRALVDELHPREVVEMPGGTGQQEAGREHIWRLALAGAVSVDVPGPVGAHHLGLEREQAAGDRREQVAAGATQPAREHRDRDADLRPLVERVGGLRQVGRGAQARDLVAEVMADGGEQALLGDRFGVAGVPVVKAHDDHRQVGQVDDRAHPEGLQQLAGTKLPHPRPGPLPPRRHVFASSSPVAAGSNDGWVASPRSASLSSRPISASTSRRLVGQVHSPQAPMPGSLSNP